MTTPRLVWYALSGAVGLVIALGAWGVETVEYAIKHNSEKIEKNSEHAQALERRLAQVESECQRIQTTLDFVLDQQLHRERVAATEKKK